jgi:hypothetical protein
MGSMNSRARPAAGDGSAFGVASDGGPQTAVTPACGSKMRVFRIQETVLLEVRGHRISPQIKTSPTMRHIGKVNAGRSPGVASRERQKSPQKSRQAARKSLGGTGDEDGRDSCDDNTIASSMTPKKSDDGVTINHVDLEEQERIEYCHTVSATQVANGENEDPCDSECFPVSVLF